jgi:hypothetical protein
VNNYYTGILKNMEEWTIIILAYCKIWKNEQLLYWHTLFTLPYFSVCQYNNCSLFHIFQYASIIIVHSSIFFSMPV